MEPIHVMAALLSAVLHASWNAAVKTSGHPTEAMTAQMIVSGTLVLPVLLWIGLPNAAATGWLVMSTTLNVLTVSALLRAYAAGGFGAVYPITRAVAVMLVVPLAAMIAGERIGFQALCGVAIIAAALAVLAVDAARDRDFPAAALGWTIVAGVINSAYVLCDAQGVRAAGSPWAYGCVVSVLNAAGMCWRQRRLGSPVAIALRQWRVGLPAGAGAAVSYLLILWVWSGAPIAPTAALRDTSAVFALLIAVFWLREPFTRTRLLAVLLSAVAVPLLRLG